jgi:hypothetical protein
LRELDCTEFQINQQIATEKVQSILIGTDGVIDLIKAENRNLPRKLEKVGSLSQFWQSDRYFDNPDLVRRKLFLINHQADGLLPDDTTLITLRICNMKG